MEGNLVKGKILDGTMRKTKRLKQYLARLRNTIESQWTCVPNVELFSMRENVHALCVEKEGMMKDPAPLRVLLPRKGEKSQRKRKKYVHVVTQKGIEHRNVHGIRQNPWIMNLLVSEFENIRPTICAHCRALDHLIEDCPALKSADERRRQIQCERCGKMGHDVTACLDETQIKKEKEMEEALKQKQKELERTNKRMRDLKHP